LINDRVALDASPERNQIMPRLANFLIALSLTALGSNAFAERAIPLHIAIDKGLVSVTVNGRGSSTGDSVQVTVQRTTTGTVSVDVVPGTVIESTSGDVQSMAIGGVKYERIGNGYYEAESIELTDDKQHVYILQGFCRDFGKPTPQSKSTFNVTPPDAANASVLVQAKRVGASTKLIQAAIWIQRSNVSDKEIQQAFPMTQDEIQAARQLLVSIEQPESTVDVQLLVDKLRSTIGDRLAERRANRAPKARDLQNRGATPRVLERLRIASEGVQLEVFDKIKVAIEN